MSRQPARKRRRNLDAFQPGDVVHYVQGWDAKKHPTVTGTILQRYFRGDGDEWLVESPSPYTGELERTAVREEKLKRGPAPVKVLPFARPNPRKRRNPGLGDYFRAGKRAAAETAAEASKAVSAAAAEVRRRAEEESVKRRADEPTLEQAIRVIAKAHGVKVNPHRRRNPDLSGALTISHEASGDVLIRHVAHNPRPASTKARANRNPSAAHAAPSISAALLDRIRDLTRNDHHTGALLLLARDVLKSPTFAKKVLGIQLDQNRAGYLTEALQAKRAALSARMFAQAKRRLSVADYALLRRSF